MVLLLFVFYKQVIILNKKTKIGLHRLVNQSGKVPR